MNNLQFACTAMALLFVGVGIAEAQTAQKPKEGTTQRSRIATSSKSVSANPPRFSPVFWDAQASVLKYMSNDVPKVFKWLENKVDEKAKSLPRKPDSFSTEGEREAYRAAVVSGAPSFPPLPLPIDCEKRYDAENQRYQIVVKADVSPSSGSPVGRNLEPLSNDFEKTKPRSISTPAVSSQVTGSYLAQNKFGASFKVQEVTTKRYLLFIPFGPDSDPITAFSFKYPGHEILGEYGSYTINIPMSSINAREVNDHLKCLGVVSILWPTLVYSESGTVPNRYNDYKNETNLYYSIFGKLDQIIVFNVISGEVLGKVIRSE